MSEVDDPIAACVSALAAYVQPHDGFSSEDVARVMCTQFADSEYTTGAIESLQGALTDTNNGLNTLYLLSTGALVFIMHGGFAMLCAGSVRSKNALNILLQTILDACVSAISWYLVGWAFAYGVGGSPNAFIGNAQFGMYRWTTAGSASPEALEAFNPAGSPWGYHMWFFQWAFAATATTIPAGCVAERFNFNAYLGYSFFLSAFVYPVVAHWVWCPEGWLNYVRTTANNSYLVESGYIDFAGSSVVHMVGGFSGLMGCILVGPRMGRFDSSGKPVDMPGHSATLVVLGTVLLWFGWYGFNPGSQLFINNSLYAAVAGRAAVVTTLGGAAGGLATLLNGFLHSKAWDLVACCNGTLVGFVVITAGCHVVEPWAAIGYCFIAGFIFDGVVWLFLKLKIDDPLCAAPMHGFTGWWGILMVGCLAKKEYIFQSYIGDQVMYQQPEDTWVKTPYNENAGIFCGAFYPGCGGRLLAAQVIGSLTILGWVCFLMGCFFFVFKVLGKLRISPEDEQAGLDVSKHGGSAYNYDHGLGKPDKAHVSAA